LLGSSIAKSRSKQARSECWSRAHGMLTFDQERAESAELLKGKDMVREQFRAPMSKT